LVWIFEKNTQLLVWIFSFFDRLLVWIFEKNTEKGIRTSLENFGQMEKIDIYPLYGVWNLVN
jgi:hypothetical protein